MNRLFVFFGIALLSVFYACDPKPREADSNSDRIDSLNVRIDSTLVGTDSVRIDSIAVKAPNGQQEKDEIDLWDPTLFDSIPKYTEERSFKMDPYQDIIKRYETDDFVYSENIKDRVGVLQRILARLADWIGSIMPDNPYKFREEFGYVFAFLAVIALAFILYKVLYNRKQYFIKHDEEEGELDALAYVERNLMNSNLEPYIQEAITTKNYALGIRYLQLLNIQKLAQTDHIKWKQSKTNAEFAQEIRNEELRRGFLECTRIFDYVWFGQFELMEANFAQYQQLFTQYQNQIK
ncbi:DUF4129 domain-containing protein [Sphingobacterium sp. UGAL515B_05]|uniref:DUF4129 domain-containing protein n=1 Tax=Sphingobacterium sp. UGAL515B_05 TaxID=2986767 RepID=UPI0029547BC6|nr:DUF4129 domain-containing protein [Sphingobacterium sp. UGAL515B_05]WON96409.1 DUF4129 domain-containing protein [Sphingobacterium sp. UGAL515B_05]